MMKHIKRKTLKELSIPKEKLHELFPENAPDNLLKKIKYKDVKDKQAILLMESGELLRSFFYNDNGKACTIPLANPVLIYFNLAQSHLRNIQSLRDSLLGIFSEEKNINEDSLQLFYGYFGVTSSFVVMLMTAIEAFVNQKIDKDYKYHKPEQKKYVRVYDYFQIQRWIPLTEKISEILNKESNKNFSKNYPNKQAYINNLKELRDFIVHTKAENNYESYIELYRKSLSFKFNEAIESVRDFINYYEENLIEPCPCGVDS
ncbi:MAG: hypothetical protein JNN00_02380 [Chitinophagaceae bacterium]|nr:hypothetical protein [Chitinophagaceae bacterium]